MVYPVSCTAVCYGNHSLATKLGWFIHFLGGPDPRSPWWLRPCAAHGRLRGIRKFAPVCTPLNTCFLWPTRVQILNNISIGSALFKMGRPSKLPLPVGMWTPSNRSKRFLGPTPVLNPNGISISRFWKPHWCDKQTDRPRTLLGR